MADEEVIYSGAVASRIGDRGSTLVNDGDHRHVIWRDGELMGTVTIEAKRDLSPAHVVDEESVRRIYQEEGAFAVAKFLYSEGLLDGLPIVAVDNNLAITTAMSEIEDEVDRKDIVDHIKDLIRKLGSWQPR